MAEFGEQEKDNAPTDAIGAVNVTNSSEPVAKEPLQHGGPESNDSDLQQGKEKEGGEDMHRTMTAMTNASTMSVESQSKEKKPWYTRLNPLKRSIKRPIPKERAVSMEHRASFLSLLTFQWMAPLMSTGYQKPLELNDIWMVNPNRASPVLSTNLSASFQRRVARGDKYPLLWALYETFTFEFWLGGICQLFASIFLVLSPFYNSISDLFRYPGI